MYQVVFDASQKGPDWWFPAFGLIFVAAGVGLVTVGGRLDIFKARRTNPRFYRRFSWFFLCFAPLWTTVSGVGVFLSWHSAQAALSTGSTRMVEGPVENFHPMPYTGHDEEHFTVSSVYFAYSDYVLTPGFKQTSSHGGPVHAGLYVRIHYVQLPGQGNVIAELEIRS